MEENGIKEGHKALLISTTVILSSSSKHVGFSDQSDLAIIFSDTFVHYKSDF
jgi:hypothetical protein